jgi:hypothetical protein
MKGIVFNLFEEFVSGNWDEESYDALLETCPLRTQEPFVGPDTYPDDDLTALVVGAAKQFGMCPTDVLRSFGRSAFPRLADKYPVFLEGHDSAKSFLMSVHDVIHVEVRKLHSDAITPSFRYEDPAPDQLTIEYSSPRKLCFLMEGFLEGVAGQFDVKIDYQQRRCMHEGADNCEFLLRFSA